MNKKIIVFIVIIPIIILTIFYYRPIEVSDLIDPLSSKNLPLKVETAIFFSSHSKKELEVSNEDSLEELIELMENIKVMKKVKAPESYSPLIKETYWFTLYREDNKYHYIDILNSKYIRINNRYYAILGNPDLSKIYNIIILDQDEGKLDEFYYDLIEKN